MSYSYNRFLATTVYGKLNNKDLTLPGVGTVLDSAGATFDGPVEIKGTLKLPSTQTISSTDTVLLTNSTQTITGYKAFTGGISSKVISITSYTTPDNTWYGAYVVINYPTTSNINQALPTANTVTTSSVIIVWNNSSYTQNLYSIGGSFFGYYLTDFYFGGSYVPIIPFDAVTFISDGANWRILNFNSKLQVNMIEESSKRTIRIDGYGGSGYDTGVDFRPWYGRTNSPCRIGARDDGAASANFFIATASGSTSSATDRLTISSTGVISF
jgi:hypothetical protein